MSDFVLNIVISVDIKWLILFDAIYGRLQLKYIHCIGMLNHDLKVKLTAGRRDFEFLQFPRLNLLLLLLIQNA